MINKATLSVTLALLMGVGAHAANITSAPLSQTLERSHNYTAASGALNLDVANLMPCSPKCLEKKKLGSS